MNSRYWAPDWRRRCVHPVLYIPRRELLHQPRPTRRALHGKWRETYKRLTVLDNAAALGVDGSALCCFWVRIGTVLLLGTVRHYVAFGYGSALCCFWVRIKKYSLSFCIYRWTICTVAVLALPAPWARFLRPPLTAIQTHTKKGKGYNEITI